MNNTTDHFENKSKSWDMSSMRVQNAKSIADLITTTLPLHNTMEVMDFGAGTGLLSHFIAPCIGKIIAVDNSPSMLAEFAKKADLLECEVELLQKDLSVEEISHQVDGIISSMTLHHLEDIHALFSKFYAMLREGGFIALADLDEEDGSFHGDNTGVFHFGFSREKLEVIAKEVGFKEIKFEVASTITKPHRDFTIFLMSATK